MRASTPRYSITTRRTDMQTLRTFLTVQEAREYRHEHGTGGWIFAPDDGSESILFPPDVAPIGIFRHSLTRGSSGALIGNA